ncbi:MAG: DUF308 domain-containing protein [Promethearchaeota archaeon]
MLESTAKPMPVWFKWANILIGIIALILGIGTIFFAPLLGAETFVIFIGALLLFTGILKTVHSYRYTEFPRWLRYLTIIFGVVILGLGIPLIIYATEEHIVAILILFTLILIGVFLMMINIQIGEHPGSGRSLLIVLGAVVVIIIIAIWIGHFLGLLTYLFFIMIGFFIIALDALATGIFR